MSARLVRLEHDHGVARVTLDRPPLNVLHLQMLDELASVLDEVRGLRGVKVIVLAAAGRAFSAGVDVGDHTPDRAERMLARFHGVLGRVLALEMPVVAVVHGAALGGGCELAVACDVVLAAAGARFGQPEIRLAAFPPAAAVLLPRRIGRGAALDLILTGRTIDAGRAMAIGLATQVWPDEVFAREAEEYVAALAAQSRPVLRLAKRAVDESLAHDVGGAIMEAERLYVEELMPLEDAREGIAAFLEKRQPVWKEA